MNFKLVKIIILFLSVHTVGVFGQAMMGPYWLYDKHYLTDKYIFNPAFAGSQYDTRVFISTHRMDLQLHDAPTVHLAGAHGSLGIKRDHSKAYRSGKLEARNAVGGLVFADNNGPFQTIGVKFDYAYSVPLNRNSTTLSFGLGGMLFSKRVRLDQFSSVAIDDPLISASMGNKVMIPDFNAGIVLSHQQFYAGFSVSQLLENSYRFSDFTYTPSQVYRNYYLLTGYRFVYDKFELEPSIAAGHNSAPETYRNLGNFADVNVECFLKPVVFTVSYRIDGYLSASLLYRAPRLELGMRAELFSTNSSDAPYGGIALTASYTFLPSNDKGVTNKRR